MSGGGGSRRGFFRDLIRSATESFDALRDETESEPTLEPSFVRAGSGVPVAARAAGRLATPAELAALCHEVGLGPRAADAEALARVGVRLTPTPDGTSTVGGALPPGDLAPPEWQGEALRFLVDVDLAAMPASLPLPREGRLVLFASHHAPTGRSPDDAGAVAVRHVLDASRAADGGVEVSASPELVLPPEPAALELGGDELALWGDLRARLAAAQGVELEETADYHALHRVLGFPDAVAEYMELEADLVARGFDLDADDVDLQRESATPWTLLFQVSSDVDAGIALPLYERLFVFIRDADLAAGRFDDVRAFVR